MEILYNMASLQNNLVHFDKYHTARLWEIFIAKILYISYTGTFTVVFRNLSWNGCGIVEQSVLDISWFFCNQISISRGPFVEFTSKFKCKHWLKNKRGTLRTLVVCKYIKFCLRKVVSWSVYIGCFTQGLFTIFFP